MRLHSRIEMRAASRRSSLLPLARRSHLTLRNRCRYSLVSTGTASGMPKKHTFIDLCAGCGGLSLGLRNAGWQGLFAVEKNGDAFATLSHNLIEKKHPSFAWPSWLERSPHSLEDLTAKHAEQLRAMRGQVDLLAGGPPCQGFSTFGLRKAHDPRNQVFRQYLKVVELLQPKMVLMENVRGILCPFKGDDAPRDSQGMRPWDQVGICNRSLLPTLPVDGDRCIHRVARLWRQRRRSPRRQSAVRRGSGAR